MGYWAKDGSYVRDEHDHSERETQGQEYDRIQRSIAYSKEYEERQKKAAEARREFEANAGLRELEENKIKADKRNAELQTQMTESKKRENRARYGTDFDLRNPQSISERESRANYWRIRNGWCSFKNYINGKSAKYYTLSDQLRKAQTEAERLEIIEKIEQLFPTKTRDIEKVERQQRRA